ncbi:MAG TPA: hypothetical protein VFA33_17025 [Bryobacteraceae bacterium]|nr:hypothetical protein [Bryobacteraceae bacterium]
MSLDERLEALTHSLELLAQIQADCEARHDREMAEIRAELRRGIRLGIEAAIRERRERHAVELRQAATEEKLEKLIEALLRGRSGNGGETRS